MPGPVSPARPKPLRRGEGPGHPRSSCRVQRVDGRDKPGHDDAEASVPKTRPRCSHTIASSNALAR
ncbi:hypothetical protein BST63_07320 [Bradyrhizobium canariense]|uniref:Uncharacterized protein n=1 Tax=Bradyrhizobium canariense TaxID=255045 RepID=A0A1X3FWT2_9BRAD|nr:hypothetical protein BST65_05030 [Bradyrhizobium canariense]OSI35462.1 hypothetical protein BST66_08270 [Bradyrhizobium canariense]OSI47460.1 hypothetical protein BST67_21440 [Bradyrhizobium canariense]OSI47596.1 hypothetical protein BSZ20_08680 [Bradyrhizobium canariense]OSI58082.1 hypothetical protein BSZ15_10985 [Bradyrhizobium canariense]